MKFSSKSVLSGAIAAAVSFGSVTLAEEPAQALSLVGSNLSLSGRITINRQASDLYNFSFLDTEIAADSSSPPFAIGTSVSIANLTGISKASTFGPLPNFISGIQLTDGSSAVFNLERLNLSVTEERNSLYSLVFEGRFLSSVGETIGFGSITSQFAGTVGVGRTVTRTLSGDIAAVPTPALLPGLLGMGAAAIRKKRKGENSEATPETVEVNA
jgi:hypothetical protein